MTGTDTTPRTDGLRQIVVAGMGPVGMTAALALARRGLDVLVLEAGSDLAEESRASTFHPPTLEMLDAIGVAEPLIAGGLVAPLFQYRGRDEGLLVELDLGLLSGETRFPFRLQNEQNNLTAIILERLREMPNVELRFDAPVGRVESAEGHAKVYVGEDVSLDAEPILTEWLIAADGSNSAVRRTLGIAFDGITYPVRYLVISTELELRDLIPGLAPVSYISDPNEWHVLLRTPRHWRALFPIPEGETDEEARSPEAVERRMQGVHRRDEPYPVAHTTLYRVHQRVAASFRNGRILLAGDSAHINNPLGGMGMNSGIHDAIAAATVVAEALGGADPERCAEAYASVRRSVALEYVQADTHRNYEQLRERDPAVRAARQQDLLALGRDPERMRELLRRSSMLESSAEAERRLRAALAVSRGPRRESDTPGDRLRKLLARDELLVAPGCYDAVTARLVEEAGFACGYISGAAISATTLGEPDLGFAGRGEVVAQALRLAAATRLPLICDADTGYGNPLHAAYAIAAFERAGIAAVHVEDQVMPKRCGHMSGKAVIPADEMVRKLRAAVEARDSMLVIARTDAYALEGLDGTLERVRAYAECGVDALFVEGAHSREALAAIHAAVPELPLLLNRSEGAHEQAPDDPELLLELGVRVVIHPVSALLAATRAARDAYAAIHATGVVDGAVSRLSWEQLNELLGLPAALAREARFAGPNEGSMS